MIISNTLIVTELIADIKGECLDKAPDKSTHVKEQALEDEK